MFITFMQLTVETHVYCYAICLFLVNLVTYCELRTVLLHPTA